MVRQIYVGVLVQLPNGDPAPDTVVSFWDDLTAGNNITDQVVGLDGFSAYTAKTDSQGLLPHLRGPDGYDDLGIFADTGAGQRFMLLSHTAFQQVADQLTQLATTGVGGGPVGGGTGTVKSVNQVAPDSNGDVVLGKSSVGLDKVDNTADTGKPVSTPQAAAITAAKARANHTGTQPFLSTTTGKRVSFSTDPASVPAGADVDTLVVYLTSATPTAQPPGPAIQLTVDA